ncbi:hypothetical protein S40288_06623 [Stachybotrys chartarum IBT 40288]|nr:hypothetical protein S40288_06623 [Stachybotrys chartarum IBT 40288]
MAETKAAHTLSEAQAQASAPAPAPAPAVPDSNGKPAEAQPSTPQTHDVPPAADRPVEGEDGAPRQAESSKANTATASRPTSIEIDKSMPEDFDGELSTTNELPSPDLIRKIENYMVLDRHGKSSSFKSLYSGPNAARRVLVIFIRHFFCGNCQDYLRTLSESITPEMLLRLPVSTFITVIGCGDPKLIETYAAETKCPFPIYTDPNRALFQALGMTTTWDSGSRPAYMKKSLALVTLSSIASALKQVPKGNALKSGHFAQVGGEFLFEPTTIDTPISTPQYERQKEYGLAEGAARVSNEAEEEDVGRRTEEKKMTWCHRMKTTRDHAEIPELMEILGLDGQGRPIKNMKRWERALSQRKGTGLSMASQMNQRGKEVEA